MFLINTVLYLIKVNSKTIEGTVHFLLLCLDFLHVKMLECILALQTKNSEGFNRMPQRILVDGADILIVTFEGLFSRIYAQVKVPAQWQVSKTIPVYKNKAERKDIKNQRPISNLC